MTETLRRVIAQIEQLPDEQQDALAEILLRELEDREWDALVASRGSQRFLEELTQEASIEHARGETRQSTDRW